LGFYATPSFLINGKKVVGAAGFDTFKNMVDAALGTGG